jgi:RNA polymerase sigma-70 factor (sigma-E family)
VGRQTLRTELDADFTEFVEANAHRIRALALWLSGDPDRAADLAQSALERTYARWGRVQAGEPMAYVRKALLNQQRDWWRRRQHRPEWPTAEVPDVRSQDDHAVALAQRDVMLAALAQLTRRERQVLVLRYYADLSDARIAAEIGVAIGTVKSTSARGLRKMRVLLSSAGAPVPADW